MLRQNAVLPIDGRAATITSSEFWKPVVNLSRSAKPLGTPVIADPLRCRSSMCSIVDQSRSLIRTKPDSRRCWPMVKIFPSALSSSSVAVDLPSYVAVMICVAASIR